MTIATLFITIGAIFAVGLAADQIGRKTPIPRITLLLLAGVAAGQFGWIGAPLADAYDILSITALTFVAFLLGGGLRYDHLVKTGRRILAVSLAVVIASVAIVAGGLILIGVDPALALIFGGIATATAPAATLDVIRQSGVESPFTETLAGIVAVDDAWGLLAFSLCLGLVAPDGHGAGMSAAVWEIGGAIGLGLAVGLPGAMLTGRIRGGEPLEIEALTLVFLSAGLAHWAEVSFLIAGMTSGAVIVNFARHHERAFHEIEHIQLPFMILFFILAGASLEVAALATIGAVGLAYIALRVVSRIVGGWIGARIGHAPMTERPYYGLALLPQAGVAVGMALIAARALPEHADTIIALTIGTTIVFEIAGPVLTLWAIRRVTAREAS